MNGFAFSRPIQSALQLGEKFGSLRFFSGCDQGQQLLLRAAGCVQKTPIDFTTTQGGACLFGGRGSVGHKRKQCLKGGEDVNP